MYEILIIDDDVELCELVSEYLKREGLSAEYVHTGEEGIEAALGGSHWAIVLDVMLPSIGGFEVLRRLRAAPAPTSSTPVLMLTARGDEVDTRGQLRWMLYRPPLAAARCRRLAPAAPSEPNAPTR